MEKYAHWWLCLFACECVCVRVCADACEYGSLVMRVRVHTYEHLAMQSQQKGVGQQAGGR